MRREKRGWKEELKAADAAMFDVRCLRFDVKASKTESGRRNERASSQRDWAGAKFAVTCGVHDIKFCDEPPISDRAP
jgi:hypothetical protein